MKETEANASVFSHIHFSFVSRAYGMLRKKGGMSRATLAKNHSIFYALNVQSILTSVNFIRYV